MFKFMVAGGDGVCPADAAKGSRNLAKCLTARAHTTAQRLQPYAASLPQRGTRNTVSIASSSDRTDVERLLFPSCLVLVLWDSRLP